MQITVFAAGSQGDIQPCLALGKGLQQAGIDVLMAAPQNFAASVQAQGLAVHALRGDVQQIMAGETGRKYMESGGGNPLSSILAMRRLLGPIAVQMVEDVLEASRGADALITLAVFAPFGQTVAQVRGIPLILVEPTPVLPATAFPAPGWPVQTSLGGRLNRFSGLAMLHVIWQWYGPFVNEFRRRYGLRPLRAGDFHRILTSVPLLGAYSPAVISRPREWGAHMHITGYWFQDAGATWTPPAKLAAFLQQGAPPVYVGFGSMSGRAPQRLAGIVLEALADNGQRGVLAAGWGGLQIKQAPANVFVLEAAPHDWLFPRMAAVVHHGGAGTTAEGLRAGAPTVIVPFIVDQLFWGKRVQALGAGPAPIKARQLTAANLAGALRQALSDPAIRQRAQAVGQAIRAGDGVGRAVQIIQQHLGVER